MKPIGPEKLINGQDGVAFEPTHPRGIFLGECIAETEIGRLLIFHIFEETDAVKILAGDEETQAKYFFVRPGDALNEIRFRTRVEFRDADGGYAVLTHETPVAEYDPHEEPSSEPGA